MILDAADLDDSHPYLAQARPNWRRTMSVIRNAGGPWGCPSCGGPSYLCYRCSKCGADLAGERSTHGRQS